MGFNDIITLNILNLDISRCEVMRCDTDDHARSCKAMLLTTTSMDICKKVTKDIFLKYCHLVSRTAPIYSQRPPTAQFVASAPKRALEVLVFAAFAADNINQSIRSFGKCFTISSTQGVFNRRIKKFGGQCQKTEIRKYKTHLFWSD